uniref:G_PROTEIN_RECEP_F1_2 domain-containing protein n=1 Tax=Parastrongyloides trichosuri TaxID=131310 RepID=A0A0N4ZVM9_PARTI
MRYYFNYFIITFNTLGILACLWIMYITVPLLLSSKTKNNKIPRSIVFYIFILCLGALFAMIGMIFLDIFLITQTWSFSDIICVAYLMNEKITIFLAPIVVLFISHTCHAMVCGDVTAQKKAALVKYAFIKVMIALVAIIIILIPIPLYASKRYLEAKKVYLCEFNPPNFIREFLHYTACFVSFACPLLGILYWYLSVPVFLKKRANTVIVKGHSSTHAIKRIIKTVVILTIVYLIFWSPYWLLLFKGKALFQILHSIHIPQVAVNYIQLTIHLLPYISSLIYPLIFTLMNTSIRKAHDEVMGLHKKRFQRLPSEVMSSFHSTFQFSSTRGKQTKLHYLTSDDSNDNEQTKMTLDCSNDYRSINFIENVIANKDGETIKADITIISNSPTSKNDDIEKDDDINTNNKRTIPKEYTQDSVLIPHQDDCIL